MAWEDKLGILQGLDALVLLRSEESRPVQAELTHLAHGLRVSDGGGEVALVVQAPE